MGELRVRFLTRALGSDGAIAVLAGRPHWHM